MTRHGSARGPGHRSAREVLAGDEHHARAVGGPTTEPPTQPIAVVTPDGPGHQPDAGREATREPAPGSEHGDGREAARNGAGHEHRHGREAARDPTSGHGHGHGHGHGPAAPAGHRVRVLLAVLLVPCALAALVGLVVLRPTGGTAATAGAPLQQPVRGQVTAVQTTDCSPGDGQGRCAALVVAMSDGPRAGRDLVQIVPLEPGTPRFTVGDPVVLGWSGGDPEDPGSYPIVDFQRGGSLAWLAGSRRSGTSRDPPGHRPTSRARRGRPR